MGEWKWTLVDNPTTGDCAQAIEEIRTRLAAVEKTIGFDRMEAVRTESHEDRLTNIEICLDNWELDERLEAVEKAIRRIEDWQVGHSMSSHTYPRRKSAEGELPRSVNNIRDEQFLNDYVAERERWLKHACPVAFDVYWRNKQKGGE